MITAELRHSLEGVLAKHGHDGVCEDEFCLVNDAVYIAREGSGKDAKFSATGAQFQHPYVFNTLFGSKDIDFEDYCETKQVGKGVIYLDFSGIEKPQPEDLEKMHFIGKIGRFVPVPESSPMAGRLWRFSEGKFYAVTGTKDYKWAEAGVVKAMGENSDIDMTYFEALVNKARDDIEYYGSFEWFCNG